MLMHVGITTVKAMGVLVVDAIHTCFSHGLLEQMVFYKYATRNWSSTTLFFRRSRFDEFPNNKMQVYNGSYTGWIGKWLYFLINSSKVMFEHLGNTFNRCSLHESFCFFVGRRPVIPWKTDSGTHPQNFDDALCLHDGAHAFYTFSQ